MSWTYQSNATVTAVNTSPVTVNKPASVASGDLMVAALVYFNGLGSSQNYLTYTNPTSWTTVSSDAQGFGASHSGTSFAQSIHIAWKIATGSEPTTYSWTFTGGPGSATDYVDATILRFTPSAGTVSYDNGFNNNGVSTTPNFGASAITIDSSALVVEVMTNWDYNSGQSYTPTSLTTILGGFDGVIDVMYSVTGATTLPANEHTTITNASTWVTKAASFKIAGGGGTTYNLSGSTTQTQTLTLPKQIGAVRSLSQGQTLSLVRGIALVRSLAQPQTLSLTTIKAFLRTVTTTQSQTLALLKQINLVRALTQGQSASVVAQKVYLRTVSATQTQTLALLKQAGVTRSITQTTVLSLRQAVVRTLTLTQAQALSLRQQVTLTRALSQAQTLALTGGRLFVRTVSATVSQLLSLIVQVSAAPPPNPIVVPSPAPRPGVAVSNYLDWPELIVTPSDVSTGGRASSNNLPSPGIRIISNDVPPPTGEAIGGP